MGHEPNFLLDIAEWNAARLRCHKPPCDTIYVRLLEAADRHLGSGFDEMAELPPWNRVFAWHNVLLELVLVGHLSEKESYRKHAMSLIHQLAASKGAGWSLFDRYTPHGHGIVLTALCLVYDLTSASLSADDRTTLETVIEIYASGIFNSSNSNYWGDTREARDMWNHSMVGYAALAHAAPVGVRRRAGGLPPLAGGLLAISVCRM